MNFFDASEWDSVAAKHAARAEQEYERNDATEEQRRGNRDFWLSLSASATKTARRLRARDDIGPPDTPEQAEKVRRAWARVAKYFGKETP